MKTYRIAHLSDLHFSSPTFNPAQFFSKRWVGNWNLILFRRRLFQTACLKVLPSFLEDLAVKTVCITGDLTTTARKKEFVEAKQFVDSITSPTFLLPGNHDVYTYQAEREKLFYQFFPNHALEKKRVFAEALASGWWWVALDCSIATPIFSSHGEFSPSLEQELEATLGKIPQNDKVILGNHFPLFSTGKKKHELKRAEALRNILKKYPSVKLYLHGHVHHPSILDAKAESLPLIVNCGSSTYSPNGIFYTLDLGEKGCEISSYRFIESELAPRWSLSEKREYLFR